MPNYELIPEAQPLKGGQMILLAAGQVDEIMYGGARGSAKSHGLLLEWLKHQSLYGNKAKGLMIRRNFKDMQDLLQRAIGLYRHFGAKWTNATDKTATFVFPNGALLKFGHMNSDKEWIQFKGSEYTRIYVDEADQFPNWEPIGNLLSCLGRDPAVKSGLRLSSNPWGDGNSWILDRYFDEPGIVPYKPLKLLVPDEVTGTNTIKTRMYIPGRLCENPKCNTPEYRANLMLAADGREEVYRAWLKGDYRVRGGAFFRAFDKDKHVIQPFIVPPYWPRICAWDPGSGHPSALVYFAVVCDDEPWRNPRKIGGDPDAYAFAQMHRYKGNLPTGSLVQYREIYFAQKSGGAGSKYKGLQLPYQEQCKRIVEIEKSQFIHGVHHEEELDRVTNMVRHAHRVAGRDIINELGRESIQKIAASYGLDFYPAQKSGDLRLRHTGWNQINHRLYGENHRPMIYFMNHCTHTIRVIQTLVIDKDKPEDVLKEQDDDLGDAVRYACMQRPYTSAFDDLSGMYPAKTWDDGTSIQVLPPPLPGRAKIQVLPEYEYENLNGRI